MHTQFREKFNGEYTDQAYQAFMDTIERHCNHRPPFKVAETPVFIPNDLKNKLTEACYDISNVICQSNFKQLTNGALLPENLVPNENEHAIFLQMDFGICKNEQGELTPQLIEIQGFPTLYFYQDMVANAYRQHFDIPGHMSHLLGGITSEEYREMLRRIIVGDSDPKNVVLLEVEPFQQATLIDFLATSKALHIPIKCVTDLKVDGRTVYYLDDQGRKIEIEKIYNRVIFDELINKTNLKREFYFTNDYNVKYIGHPHWFFRISKYTMPFLQNKYVPPTFFLNELDEIPEDLSNYVLKPLYSFAGTGVIINLNRYDIDAIKDKENYILQRKVSYEPVVKTPDSDAKCEIRMLMLWEENAPRPVLVNNLVRLSKGEMIGVRYNKGKSWVGGSVGFFES